MGRILTSGFEWLSTSSDSPNTVHPDGRPVGTWTNDTTNKRSGASCASIALVSATQTTRTFFIAAYGGNNAFARVYFRKTADPGTDGRLVMGFLDQSEWGILLNTDGTLSLVFNKTTVAGSASPVLANNVWYRLELMQKLAAADVPGQAEARVDGVPFATSTASHVTITSNTSFAIGPLDTNTHTGSVTFLFDDLALNDDAGSSQTSWPGEGKIVLLVPISDNARGANWTAGAGGTSNIFGAVDNTPPTGVALGSATDASQLKNVAKDTTGNYDANMTTYSTAGIVAGNKINVVHPWWNVSGSSATAISHAMLLVSNPQGNGGTESTVSITSTAGTYPSNWKWQGVGSAQVVHDPSVTLGTSPVMRVGKRTSSTSAAMCDAMGIYVDYRTVSFPPVTSVIPNLINR